MSLFADAFSYIREAESELDSYERSLNEKKENLNQEQFIVEKRTIDTPPNILKQEIMYQKYIPYPIKINN